MKKLILAILLTVLSTSAIAEKTGEQLYSELKSNSSFENAQGISFLEGVIDMESWYVTKEIFKSIDLDNPSNPSKKFIFEHYCLNGITLGEVKDIVVGYMASHPEKKNLPAHTVIWRALLEQFDCAANPKTDWTIVYGSVNPITYVDLESIQRIGNKSQMTNLRDYKDIQITAKNKAYSSRREAQEYDCKTVKLRGLSQAFHAGNMGKGDLVDMAGSDSDSWLQVNPKSNDMALWKIACGKK